VIVHVPRALRGLAGGHETVELPAAPTVGTALAALWARHPGLRDRIVDEQGVLRLHVNVFVGGESIRYSGGFDTPLADGAELFILPAVSGGAPAP
jgi:sulfur-carrier protein